MESEIVNLPTPDIKKVPFPDNWGNLCNACRLLWLLDYAEGEGLVVTIFPAVVKKMRFDLFGFPHTTVSWADDEYEPDRLQFYIHPPDVEIPTDGAETPREFNRYWVCSFRSLRMICKGVSCH